MAHTYHIESQINGKWHAFKKDNLSYLKGYMDAMRGQAPRVHLRLVRDDLKIIDEVKPNDSVNIGMVAGWPTADQYEYAAMKALKRASTIRKNQKP